MIRLEHIDKTFNEGTVDEVKLYDDFSFEVDTGEFVTVIGSNGSGKTTLLNIISGSMPVDSGRIILDGSDITSQKEYVRSRRIGRVFQSPDMCTVPSMDIYENMVLADNKNKRYSLTFGLNKKKAEEYRDRVAELGLGLENKMNTQVGVLSGGQRQALALLMATVTPIDLLLLDEHTAALDPKTADWVMEITDKLVRENNLTALMVTHNLNFAIKYGDRLVMMNAGRIVSDKRGEEKSSISTDKLLREYGSLN